MMTEERRKRIRELLFQHKRLLVREVSQELNISEVTIRKDLMALEKAGVLQRVHGGAILKDSMVMDRALTEKASQSASEKERIAQRAVELVKPGDVIILDSGSTTTQIARKLQAIPDITVITNAVNIATELAASPVEVILTGGTMREKSFSLVGPLAEETLRHFTASIFFLAVDGIHFEYGLTTPNYLEARVNQVMLEISSQVVVVADATKFGKRSMGVIGKLESVDRLITDDRVTREDHDVLLERGINVDIV